jgi:tripartite ATP-independent transporter DctM subunit
MSAELATIVLFGGLLLLLFLGVPVAFAIGALCVPLILLLWGQSGLLTVVTTTVGTVTDSTLMTIPLFVLMGNFLLHSGISDRLFQALSYWLSGVRGGLAIVTVIACVALDMCTGFGPGILTMGMIAVPAMLKRGYDKRLAVGTVLAGGAGDILPPSVIMIIFAFVARVSVGRLFFAGVVPGFVLAGSYMLYVAIRCYLQPQLAPPLAEAVTWKMRTASLKEVVPPALLIVVVLGSIFLGIATPTEAAAVGAFGAFLCCLAYRRFSWKMLRTSCLETLKISGMALWILIAATLFGVTTHMAGIRELVTGLISGLPLNPWAILIGMQLILLIFGMFMDDYAIVTICAPIFIPIAVALGFDLIWFSVVFILNMQVAYLTPPFGWALILMRGVAPPEIDTGDIWRSVPPFIGLQVLVLALTMLLPQLALWLPNRMF